MKGLTTLRPAPPLLPSLLPVSVLTGSSAAGRPRYWRECRSVPPLADTAVIINEFGAVGIDALLLEAADQEILEVPNGRVCCAVRQDLADTLYRLLQCSGGGRADAIADKIIFGATSWRR